MGTKTGIEWTDSTWSPIRFRVKVDAAAIARAKGYTSLVTIAEKMAGHVGTHCEHVSPGCEHCYAESNNHRCLPGNGTGLPYDRRSRDLVEPIIDEKVLLQPLKWGDKRWYDADDGDLTKIEPRKIFVENQSDLFGEWVTDEMLDRVFAVMALCPQHIFQVLTKRPERMLEYFTAYKQLTVREAFIGRHFSSIAPQKGPVYEWSGMPMPHVWLGVSVDSQPSADKFIPPLLQTPAVVRYISAEPLLGEVSLRRIRMPEPLFGWHDVDVLTGNLYRHARQVGFGSPKLDWVICGGESGAKARPMHPDWARSLRDDCVSAGVPFFFKQWGEWWPIGQMPNGWTDNPDNRASKLRKTVLQLDGRQEFDFPAGAMTCFAVGKKTAGHLLDGREWKQFPEVHAC
jgi:protein gp37